MPRPEIGIDLFSVDWGSVEDVFGEIGLHTHPGERAALLSSDPDNGAFTSVVWLPPGFTAPAPEVHSVDQEEIVIWGDFWLGDTEHRAPYYHFFPAGTEHGPVHTKNGCLIVFIHGSPIDIRYRRPTASDERPKD